MRVLVLHSLIADDAPPDERDTLVAAEAIAQALNETGHRARTRAFVPEPDALRETVNGADCVFNLVESVHGQDALAALAPAMLERLGVPFTGCGTASMALTTDKPATKRVLRAAGMNTADWHEAPHWHGLDPKAHYIVKSANADASLGLDHGAVVSGDGVAARARECAARFGGRWFAERFIDGREFNIAVLDDGSGPRVLRLAEMRFVDWDWDRPKIVTYGAKWDEHDPVNDRTVRHFGCDTEEPALAASLRQGALSCWDLFGLRGYARVDVRVGPDGVPVILEVNTNPCLSPDAGYAFAAAETGMDYAALIEIIAKAAFHG